MFAFDCPECSGTGLGYTIVDLCCGDYLPSGECCAAIYGGAHLIMGQELIQCPNCQGTGEWNPIDGTHTRLEV